MKNIDVDDFLGSCSRVVENAKDGIIEPTNDDAGIYITQTLITSSRTR